MYLKTHSMGEFIPDAPWADLAQQRGVRYYPKLLSAVPFTPVQVCPCNPAAVTEIARRAGPSPGECPRTAVGPAVGREARGERPSSYSPVPRTTALTDPLPPAASSPLRPRRNLARQPRPDHAPRRLSERFSRRDLAGAITRRAQGSRVLLSHELSAGVRAQLLLLVAKYLRTLAQQNGLSSVHVNFCTAEEVRGRLRPCLPPRLPTAYTPPYLSRLLLHCGGGHGMLASVLASLTSKASLHPYLSWQLCTAERVAPPPRRAPLG
eukprot:2356052-Prymnesium_polylepis.1